jgi:hypothetical protein
MSGSLEPVLRTLGRVLGHPRHLWAAERLDPALHFVVSLISHDEQVLLIRVVLDELVCERTQVSIVERPHF